MTETKNIIEQLRRALEADPWHGPSILQVLEGVTPAMAAAHPIPGAHSIWELLFHVTAWTRAVRARIQHIATELQGDANFPPVHNTSAEAWKASIEDLIQAHAELYATLHDFSDDDLVAPIPNRPYDRAFILHGLPQHHAYHSGQMALLKKAYENQQRGGAAKA
jgi:uncharacterized damage-inducible protein DinB